MKLLLLLIKYFQLQNSIIVNLMTNILSTSLWATSFCIFSSKEILFEKHFATTTWKIFMGTIIISLSTNVSLNQLGLSLNFNVVFHVSEKLKYWLLIFMMDANFRKMALMKLSDSIKTIIWFGWLIINSQNSKMYSYDSLEIL